DGVSFALHPGETLGIVGESGCGKSVTALSILRLVLEPGRIVNGQILFRGDDIVTMSDEEVREIRGKDIAMIFQDPLSSLNPVLTVGFQIEEAIEAHRKVPSKMALSRAVELLKQVRIPAAESRVHDYPHQFSGGMRQRAMIAMGLANSPSILIADEPTTALDVTVQAQILELLRDLNRDLKTAIILITHNMGVVASLCTRVLVMYAGRIVEQGPAEQVVKHFPAGLGASVKAVEKVSLEIYPGETVGLVGESGCGKSTLGRLITQLLPVTSGNIFFDGVDLTKLRGEKLRQYRRQLQ